MAARDAPYDAPGIVALAPNLRTSRGMDSWGIAAHGAKASRTETSWDRESNVEEHGGSAGSSGLS